MINNSTSDHRGNLTTNINFNNIVRADSAFVEDTFEKNDEHDDADTGYVAHLPPEGAQHDSLKDGDLQDRMRPQQKEEMIVGVIAHKSANKVAREILNVEHFSELERYLAVAWAAAIDKKWPLDIGGLGQEIEDRFDGDPTDENVFHRQLAAGLLERIAEGRVPSEAHAVELLHEFVRQRGGPRKQRKGTFGGDSGKESQASQLVRLAEQAGAELFHDDVRPYATVTVPDEGGTHCETYPINSKCSGKFHDWLVRLFWTLKDGVPSTQAMQEACGILAAKATIEGESHQVHLRVGADGDTIYLDLADDRGRAVKIDAAGWTVVTDPPVKFIRPANMASLPVPEKGGTLKELQNMANLPDDENFTLAVAWLIGAIRQSGPHVVLVVSGEQGSAKSTLCRMLRRLIDPNRSDLRSPPKDGETDLMIAARHGWVIAYDNLSHINNDLSDALCRVASGTGLSGRKLYTDDEENLLVACRPIIVNGIEDLATRPDLLDRSIQLCLSPLAGERKPEKDLWEEFEKRRPAIIGALLDAVVAALANVSKMSNLNLPRMADFARWVIAAESALPWPAGTFLTHYNANRKAAAETALDSNTVAAAVLRLADGLRTSPTKSWTGNATQLMAELEKTLPLDPTTGRRRRPFTWPTTANAFSGQLNRMAPALRQNGISVVKSRTKAQGRLITIEVG